MWRWCLRSDTGSRNRTYIRRKRKPRQPVGERSDGFSLRDHLKPFQAKALFMFLHFCLNSGFWSLADLENPDLGTRIGKKFVESMMIHGDKVNNRHPLVIGKL